MADDLEPQAPFDFRPFLEPFERVKWQGSPVLTGGPRSTSYLLLVVCILFAGGLTVAFAGSDSPDRPGAILIGGGMVAFLVWELLAVGPADRKLRRSIRFAVTDRQMLRGNARDETVLGRDLADIRAVEVHGDDRAAAAEGGFALPLQSLLPAFVDIADASAVAARVERLRAQAPPASRQRNPRVGFWKVVEPNPVWD